MLQLARKIFLFCSLAMFAVIAKAAPVTELLNKPNDPVAGNPHGAVTVVEFFDYQCSHCISMAPVVAAIIQANPDVRFVFKELPIRGPMSELASRAALAANKQGKYYPFSHALLSSNQPITEAFIFETAKKVGLNVSKLKKDMNSPAVANELKSNFNLAAQLQVSGTPAFFIAKTGTRNSNDVNFQLGEMSQGELQTAIDNAKK